MSGIIKERLIGRQLSSNSMPVVLPSDQVVNISQSTTSPPTTNNLATYVQADKVFSVSGVLSAAAAGVDNPILLIRNPIGNTKNIYIHKLFLGTTVTNVSCNIKVFINPTIIINGTSKAIVNNNSGSLVASTMTAFTLPTISANGTEVRSVVNGQNNNSAVVAEDGAILLNPNTNLLITSNPSSNNREVSFTILWVEL